MTDRAAPILIAGPTASGKSALALALAEAVGAPVVNADALQVYRDWRLLTARPSPAEEARVPHRLYGHVDLAEPGYSVGRWLREVAPILDACASEGRPPVIVGGTGLYLTALTEGLAPIPAIPEPVRAEADARLAREGPHALLAELDVEDPETAERLDRRNPRRIQRAWEVLRATGRGLAAWARQTEPPLVPRARALLLAPDRAELHARIAARFRGMIEAGALEEVRAAVARGLDPAPPGMQALGAKPLAAHLAGDLSLEAAIDASVVATRQYAKRQETWFRGRFADWSRLTTE
ncbi:MAG: tRNA (adenosine(37)-N6)-dimethylallyltransferase MiaA, partial [Pseudomonadota bacterium]